jgi:signal transduction histidine kinase
VRAAALVVATLYLAVLTIGWVATAPAGHDGITRTHDDRFERIRDLGGPRIDEVAPGSPADLAGLRPGDRIAAVNGVPGWSTDPLHELYHRQRAGDHEFLSIRRGEAPPYGRFEPIELTLVSRLAISTVVRDMLIWSLAGLVVVGVATFAALARPREPAAPLLLVFAACFALMPISDIWHWGLPAASLATAFDRLSTGAMLLGAVALLHLFLVFPRADAPRWLPLLYVMPPATTALSAATGQWFVVFPPMLGVVLAAFGALARSWWRAPTRLERAQLKWVLWGLGITLAALVAIPLFPAATGGRAQSSVPVVSAAAWAVFPLSLAIAILRYRLWDVDLVIGRTLLYGALTACVVLIYVLVVGGLGALFSSSGSLVPSLVATGLVALLFQPLRERLQRAVNRLLYGERDEPYAVLSRLGQRLEATLAPDAVLPTIVVTVREALRLPYAAITLERDGARLLAAEAGTPGEPLLRLPLLHQHEPIGELALGLRGAGEPFGAADRRLLDDLARQAGIAVHAVGLHAELQRARERLVAAREEERRRLRRDLHDGLGPALAAQTLKVGAARSLLRRDPEAADARLAELEGDLVAALADVRRLVYNLRPPALDELGLAAAIRQAAADHAGAPDGTRIWVDAPERLPHLPAAVEVAAYRIVQEALTNVVRHARARGCLVTLRLAASVLEVEVVDDGAGLPVPHRSGVGLTSMRERAAELGGSCAVAACPAGGTSVLARLPLPSEASAAPARPGVVTA